MTAFLVLSFFSHLRSFGGREASNGYLISSSYLSEDKNFPLVFLSNISLLYNKTLVAFHEIPIS